MDRRRFVTLAGTAAGAAILPGGLRPPPPPTRPRSSSGPRRPSPGPRPSSLPLPEYERHDGLGLADLVRRGEVTAHELLDAAAARMEAWNPRLNAVVFEWVERAHGMIEEGVAEGPFGGVPFLLKNLGTALPDTPLTHGSRLFAGHRAESGSEIVRRFRSAGFVPFGRGNAPELGISATTEPLFHGPTRNPWDPERTAGGSSGGAGAAVAAGILPVAFASDGGGSARIPASCCGLASMKPTRGRTPVGLGAALGQSLVVSRSVRDLAASLDAVRGPVVGQPHRPPPPPRPFAREPDRPPGRLRIAFSRTSPYGGRTLDPACVAAVEDVARLCGELGHEVVEAGPEYDFDPLARAMFGVLMATGVASSVDARERELGREARPGELEPYTRDMVERGRRLTARDHARALGTLSGFARRFAAFFREHDVHLTPTLGRLPLPLGTLIGTIEDADEYLAILYGFMPFTMQYNAAGLPAVSLPLHWTREGLPVGLQLGAGHGGDSLLLRLAGQLEEARPWADRRPDPNAARRSTE